MEIDFSHRVRGVDVGRAGLDKRRSLVAQDSRVDTVLETCGAGAGVATNPVVANGLIGVENKGVALRSEDINGVHIKGYRVLSVGFNNGHLVTVDSEVVIGFASDVNESNAVPLALLDIQDVKWNWGTVY